MISPATRHRTAAMSSGGIVCTPTLMARYVLPHTTYTMSRQAHATTVARRAAPVFSSGRTVRTASGRSTCTFCSLTVSSLPVETGHDEWQDRRP
jgi:hypothetical protein